MIPKIIKLIASISFFGYGVYQITETFTGNGIFLIILSILLVVLYFKNEVLIFAFLSLRKQDFDRTERILKLIKNPKSALVTKQQGFYHYLNGLSKNGELSQVNHLLKQEKDIYLKKLSKPYRHKSMQHQRERKEPIQRKVNNSLNNQKL